MAVQLEAFKDEPETQFAYKVVPAIAAGSPIKPYKLLTAPEDVEVIVVKLQVTLEITAPDGNALILNLAKPLLAPELIFAMSPSALTPAEVTEPVLKEPIVPVALTVNVCPKAS